MPTRSTCTIRSRMNLFCSTGVSPVSSAMYGQDARATSNTRATCQQSFAMRAQDVAPREHPNHPSRFTALHDRQTTDVVIHHVIGGLTQSRIVVNHPREDRKSTRLNSSHLVISYAVFCL